jgi:hypothetical protein
MVKCILELLYLFLDQLVPSPGREPVARDDALDLLSQSKRLRNPTNYLEDSRVGGVDGRIDICAFFLLRTPFQLTNHLT